MSTRIGQVGAGSAAGRHVEPRTALDGVTVAGVADPPTDRARRPPVARAAADGGTVRP